MTKVEELRDKVLANYGPRSLEKGTACIEPVDSLISAAEFLGMKKQKELDAIWSRIDALVVAEARGFAKGHAEGVAEGAEQAKADIWKAQLYGYRVQLYPFPHDEREGLRVETEVDGMRYVMVPVASVLAPTRVKP